ncbi:G patch domain-containing protein TGH [Tanacetum coccineum]
MDKQHRKASPPFLFDICNCTTYHAKLVVNLCETPKVLTCYSYLNNYDFRLSLRKSQQFQHDPAKQERFEQYLKEKYHGGLRTKDAGGSSKMSEAARARERLEFEAAAEAVTQGKWGKESQSFSQQILGASAGRGLHRHLLQGLGASWILISMPDYVKAAKEEEKTNLNKFSSTQADEQNGTNVMDIEENVERPIDLYKAYISDDSGDEEESSTNTNQPNDPTTKIEVVNTALTRIVAGDFLESLGKELGLEVPPDQPYAEKHCGCWSGYLQLLQGWCMCVGEGCIAERHMSHRLGDDQGSLFTNSNWFAFQDNIEDNAPNSATSASAMLDEVNLNRTSHGGNSSSDNEVAVGEDEDLVTCNGTSTSDPNPFIQENKETDGDLKMVENPDAT